MTIPDPTITVFLDLPALGGNFFIIEDPVKGLVESATYLIAGDVGTDISDMGFDIRIRRGRSTELDDISPGTCGLSLRNYDRSLDGLNTASPYFGYLQPGRPIDVKVHGRTIFAGQVDDWNMSYTVSGDAVAEVPAVDALGVLARREFDDWTTTAGQLAGARITDVLNRSEVGWPAAQRSIGAGVSTLVSDGVTWGSNVLNYLQLIALSDLGIIYADRAGILTFRDRHSLVNPTPIVTFADDGADVPFHGGTLSSLAARYFNRVGIDRVGGILQTAQDAALITRDGARSMSRRDLLLEDDDDSASMANWLLSLYSDPEQHVDTITVNVSALDATYQGVVAGLDIYDAVAVRWTPLGVGSEITETLTVEGVEHSIPVGGPHIVTLSLSPVSQSSVFIIEDATLGIIDGPGRITF